VETGLANKSRCAREIRTADPSITAVALERTDAPSIESAAEQLINRQLENAVIRR
jgi:hypothetical protein